MRLELDGAKPIPKLKPKPIPLNLHDFLHLHVGLHVGLDVVGVPLILAHGHRLVA